MFYHCFTTMVERVQGQYISGWNSICWRADFIIPHLPPKEPHSPLRVQWVTSLDSFFLLDKCPLIFWKFWATDPLAEFERVLGIVVIHWKWVCCGSSNFCWFKGSHFGLARRPLWSRKLRRMLCFVAYFAHQSAFPARWKWPSSQVKTAFEP